MGQSRLLSKLRELEDRIPSTYDYLHGVVIQAGTPYNIAHLIPLPVVYSDEVDPLTGKHFAVGMIRIEGELSEFVYELERVITEINDKEG